ncbi:hypothetical protein [Nocardioides sp. GXZ039]
MTFLILLAVLAVLGVFAAIRALHHDGPARPPRSHAVDPTFLNPSSRI